MDSDVRVIRINININIILRMIFFLLEEFLE